jgi:ABC-2 type transport system permease protein
MIADIVTIVWKELKEFALQRGSARATAMNMIIMIAVFGVFMPLQQGRAWVDSPLSMVAWAWVPMFLVTGMIADSFAGERERHTLETLLASRLSDRSILLGKVAAAITYGLAMTVVFMIVGLITVNASTWDGQVVLYPPATVAGALVFAILGTGMVASLGVIVSLRAATVRQAAQALSLGIIMLVWIPILLLMAAPRALTERIAASLITLDLKLAFVLVLAVMIVIDTILLGVAMARFQRSRLILD